ncbi:unnamed protein product [Thlaspi arvense]|uniref:ATPase AAA-type core domain-containing protein n=1 Tax=Thlaspi arvense TaxID=13288 RepID=A0AAU9S9C0_THLAR|nr:unnamed protein product [Thlaspi arvense]
MTDYFPHLARLAAKKNSHREKLKIYSYNKERSHWQPTTFDHHTTFETLAIEPDLKNTVIDDLDAFSKGKDFFKSVSHALETWISSLCFRALKTMLSCGRFSHPPRTDQFFSLKTLIVDLMPLVNARPAKKKGRWRAPNWREEGGGPWGTVVGYKTLFPKLMNVPSGQVSLSGLLNFVDGLWSSCGEERILIFTTNHKEKLDPALLRPGRMDVHILMGNCTPFVFKKIDDHALLDPIEKLVLEVSVTPAEVAQQLMASKVADIALKGLLEYLEAKKIKNEEETRAEAEGVIEIPKLKKQTHKLNKKPK